MARDPAVVRYNVLQNMLLNGVPARVLGICRAAPVSLVLELVRVQAQRGVEDCFGWFVGCCVVVVGKQVRGFVMTVGMRPGSGATM